MIGAINQRGASIKSQAQIRGEMNLVVVEAVELWKTRRGFSKPCGKAAEGRLSIGRQIHSLKRHDRHAAAIRAWSIRSRCVAMRISLSNRTSVVISL